MEMILYMWTYSNKDVSKLTFQAPKDALISTNNVEDKKVHLENSRVLAEEMEYASNSNKATKTSEGEKLTMESMEELYSVIFKDPLLLQILDDNDPFWESVKQEE